MVLNLLRALGHSPDVCEERKGLSTFPVEKMLGQFMNWLFKSSDTSPKENPSTKTLWALVEWKDYTENQAVFLTANGTSLDSTAAAKHDYFSIVGVPASRWTYSGTKPADEPAGHRWIPLEAGFGLKVRM